MSRTLRVDQPTVRPRAVRPHVGSLLWKSLIKVRVMKVRVMTGTPGPVRLTVADSPGSRHVRRVYPRRAGY
ncbi:hypothetical protein CITRIK5_70259 [Citricoccus sp. K5]|nr:hypothetical protein CITRIK5_70259 [Citricoccus sp. K5]